MNAQQFGKDGESFVADFLTRDGFRILETNYKKFFGEIDIIAQKNDTIAFVEVKARKNSKTSMYEIVTPAKQRKISLAAHDYIARKSLNDVTYRFDVALITYDTNNKLLLSYIPNAFY